MARGACVWVVDLNAAGLHAALFGDDAADGAHAGAAGGDAAAAAVAVLAASPLSRSSLSAYDN
ncbi:MAG: hypothetical protein ACOVRM_17090, partial [Planctomycetaceae bacterium]